MAHLPAAAHALFARQHGVASRSQLSGTGLSRAQIERLRAIGDLGHERRGVYRSPSVPPSELARCAAISIAHPDVAIGGPTAGRLYDFRRVSRDKRLHVTTARKGNPVDRDRSIVVFHTDALRAEDTVIRPDGIRIMSPARTVMDLARSLTRSDLKSVIEQAMADWRLTTGDMLDVGVDFSLRRPWIRRFMETVDDRIAGGPADSHAEVRVGQALLDRGVGGLVRQHRLDLGGRVIRFDFAIPHRCRALEVDVLPTHAETAGRESDAERDVAAGHLGWSVHRISREAYQRDFRHAIDASVDFLTAP